MAYDGLKFQFDEEKAVEVLAYIAEQWPKITAFYASKVMFFAEKKHLSKYGRPIVADTFIAMPNGPVPSTMYDIMRGNLDQLGDPQKIIDTLECHRSSRYIEITAKRQADLDVLSLSDVTCLDGAIEFCKTATRSLSDITHDEPSWQEASPNSPMDYAKMIDGEDTDSVFQKAQEFAAYGVL